MIKAKKAIFLLFFIILTPINTVLALSYKIGISQGLMNQPTSSYMLYNYGVYAQVHSEESAIILKTNYLERPEFTANDTKEQDFASFVHIGTRHGSFFHMNLDAFVGWGQINGFISRKIALDEVKNSYIVQGPSVLIESSYQYKKAEIAFGFQNFLGVRNSEEVKIKVVWPYNFIVIRLGTVL